MPSSRPPPPMLESLRSLLEQWSVATFTSNLVWTRALGPAAIAAAQRQRLADLVRFARERSPVLPARLAARAAWRHSHSPNCR